MCLKTFHACQPAYNQQLSVHEHYRKLMVSMECGSLFSASFKQETQSWLWPMLPHWRLALASYKASPHKTQRTLSKLSERSVCCFSYNESFISILSSSLLFFMTCNICLLFVQIPYLGFCACEEMGETGVWQLVDPPILPLTHGPNHSFSWREMLMQDWKMCCLAVYVLDTLNCWIFIFNPHCYKWPK